MDTPYGKCSVSLYLGLCSFNSSKGDHRDIYVGSAMTAFPFSVGRVSITSNESISPSRCSITPKAVLRSKNFFSYGICVDKDIF